MKIKKRLLILVISCCVLFFINGSRFLIVSEDLEKVDVIIVLSGDAGRVEKAVSLYNDGYAQKIMVSTVTKKFRTVDEALQLGVPEGDIIPEYQATSTYTNATFTKELMSEYGFESAIVVTSDYHTKRSKFIFDKVYKNTDISLYYSSSKSTFGLNEWWMSIEGIKIILAEYVKFAWYFVKYFYV